MGDIRNAQVIGDHAIASTPSQVSGGYEACKLLTEQVRITEQILLEAEELIDNDAPDSEIQIKLEEHEASEYRASQLRASYDCIRAYQKDLRKALKYKQANKLLVKEAQAKDAKIAELEAEINRLNSRQQIVTVVKQST